MPNFFLFTHHTKAITPPFDTPFLDATTHDGKKVRFVGVEHYTHGRNLTVMKYQGSPLLVWVSEFYESNDEGIDFEVGEEAVIAILPYNTKPLKQLIQTGEAERVLKSMKKKYPMLKCGK